MQLARALEKYANRDAVVLGIPRGGVEIGFYVARHLHAEFSIVVTRKLGYPFNPEAAFGAIAEDGSMYVTDEGVPAVSKGDLRRIVAEETREIRRRIRLLRKDKPLPDVKGKTVIIVDDGIATGATVFCTIAMCRKLKPSRIVVAAPIAGMEMKQQLLKSVDDVIILETPAYFYAVGQGYVNFQNLSDEQAIAFMTAWDRDPR